MFQRPFLLRLFILFLVLDPFIRAIVLSWEMNTNFTIILQRALDLKGIYFFNFWCVSLLGAALLYKISRWGYLLLLALQFYSLYWHVSFEPFAWPYLSSTPMVSAIIMLSANIFILAYLLVPTSRRVLLNPRLRWWDTSPRYHIKRDATFTINGNKLEGEIEDISTGGVLISLSQEFATQSHGVLEFKLLTSTVKTNTIVLRTFNKADTTMHGLKFEFSGLWSQIKFRLDLLIALQSGKYRKNR